MAKSSAGALFDEFGRCLPTNIAAPVHQIVRRYFKCDQPKLNYDEIYARITNALGNGGEISCAEFEQRGQAILDRLKADEQLENICNGVHVPFFLPQLDVGDVGKDLDEVYLPALKTSFENAFPNYDFTNHFKGQLKGRLSVATGSRHENLLKRLSQETVVGMYFPALDAYSIQAAREQVKALPEQFMLAGGVDTCAALISSPDLLLRKDGYPPLLWFSALEEENVNAGYHLEAYGYNLTFNRRIHLGHANEYWASGLVVCG